MIRVFAFIGTGLLALGASLLVGCTDEAAPPPSIADQIPVTTSTTLADTTTTTEDPDVGWFVVSVTNALPDSLTAGLASLEGVDAVSVVLVDNLLLAATATRDGRIVDEAPPGFSILQKVRFMLLMTLVFN